MDIYGSSTFEDIRSVFVGASSYIKHKLFGTKKQLAFLEDMYLLVNDGIPPNRAIEMMAQVTTGINKDVALSLADKISQGQPLADGMKEWFKPAVVEIIRVGETGGALAQTMKSAISALSQQGVAGSAMVSALLYPLIVLLMGCGMSIYLDGEVLEQFRAIKPESEWPEAGQRLSAVASFIRVWWWTVPIGLVAIIVGLRIAMRNYVGEFRPMLDKVPPFSFYKKMAAARLLETLGLLVANGVVFKSAIKVMQQSADPYMALHLLQMEALLSKGKSNIADVLDTGLIDSQNLMRLRVMAEVKGFEHGLIRMGIRGTEEATATMKLISKALGGILLFFGGFLIITIVQGMFMTGMSMAG
jgi:type II secretory pathway component PulF